MCITYIPPSDLLYHGHVFSRNVHAIFVSTHIMCVVYIHIHNKYYIWRAVKLFDITFVFLFSCFYL